MTCPTISDERRQLEAATEFPRDRYRRGDAILVEPVAQVSAAEPRPAFSVQAADQPLTVDCRGIQNGVCVRHARQGLALHRLDRVQRAEQGAAGPVSLQAIDI